MNFARERELPKAHFIWNPNTHPLATALNRGKLEISAIQRLPSSEGTPSFVVEVPLQPRATWSRNLEWSDLGLKPQKQIEGYLRIKDGSLIVNLESLEMANLRKIKLKPFVNRLKMLAREQGASEVQIRINKDLAGLLVPMTKTFGAPTHNAKNIFTFQVRQSRAAPIRPLSASIEEVYQTQRGQFALFALQDAFDTLVETIPLLTRGTGTLEAFWADALKIPATKVHSTKVHYYKKGPEKWVALLKGESRSVIVKDSLYIEEIMNEYAGFEFLKSLQLNHLELPEIVLIGQYEGRFLLAKTEVKGNTLQAMMQSRSPRLLEASEQAGKMLGEFQSKHLGVACEPNELMSGPISSLFEKMEHLGVIPTKRTFQLVEDFRLAPGQAAYGFGDIHAGQFAFANRLGLVDAEMVPVHFTTDKMPRAVASFEYSKFLTMFEIEGAAAGMARTEIEPLKQAFIRGFEAEYRGTRSTAAEAFFDANQHIDIAYDFWKEPAKQALVEHHLEQFYAKVGISKTQRVVTAAREGAELQVARVMESHLIPSYGSSEPVRRFIQTNQRQMSFRVEARMNERSGNILHTIYNAQNRPISIAKEFVAISQDGFISEMVAHGFLQGQRPAHFALPEILDIGKYLSKNSQRGLILYEFTPGTTLETLFATQSRLIPGREIGRAVAEINSMTHFQPVSQTYLNHLIELLNFRARILLIQLNLVRFPLRFSMADISFRSDAVRRNPGLGSVVHGDLHPGNLIIDGQKLTLIDMGSLVRSITPQGTSPGTPHGMAAMDRHQVLHTMTHLAQKQGYTPAEIEPLIAEFKQGYQELCNLPHTPEADAFADLFWHIDHIHTLLNEAQPNHDLVRQALQTLDQKYTRGSSAF